MSLIGSIEHFKPGLDDFASYLERLEQLFVCNAVEEDMKVAMFITLAGGETYSILKDLISPKKPSTLTYAQLSDVLSKHFVPQKLVIAERYAFYKCCQKPSQSVGDYIVEIRKLAKACKFEAFLEEALRDKLVCGLTKEGIQRKLLAEPDLTFNDACKLALTMELTEQQAKKIQVEEVNKLYVKQSMAKKSSVAVKRKEQDRQTKESRIRCKRCLRAHEKGQCPAYNWECYTCKKKGHVSKSTLCEKIQWLDEDSEQLQVSASEDEEEIMEPINYIMKIEEEETLVNAISEPLIVELQVCSKNLLVEIDSGACRSVMAYDLYIKDFKHINLEPVPCKLKVLTGSEVDVIGQIKVKVVLDSEKFELPLIVVKSQNFIPLIGRNWLDVMYPGWRNIFDIKNRINALQIRNSSVVQNAVQQLRTTFPAVFDLKFDSEGIKGFEADILIREGVTPIFHKAYNVPYAIRNKVESEIKKMVDVGVLKPVKHSDWASPVVVVGKKNGSIRVCVDFKVTLNKVLITEHYPLPNISDIFASLAGCKIFTVLDLSGAYQQVKVKKEAQKYLTINTHLGLFQYTRLTYGISSAPNIFQSIMDGILQNIKHVFCYLDDILVGGSNLSECYKNCVAVFQRLMEYGVKVNQDKCVYFENSVTYLGHKLDAEGIHPDKEKVKAVIEAPEPKDASQVRAYLGLINFYGKFLPNLSTVLKPLYELIKKGKVFEFSQKCKLAFQTSKELLQKYNVLVHYNSELPIQISVDASPYGVGAVLSHIIGNEEKPVMFASSMLTPVQVRYAHIEKEALAIIYAVRKFHKFIFGRKFTILSDHKPLSFIFDPKKAINILAANRIQRWALLLSAYEYTIKYKKGSLLGNADGLSRLPLNSYNNIEHINWFNECSDVCLSNEKVSEFTSKDSALCKVLEYTKHGWPDHINDPALQAYFLKRHELTVENMCILWGNKLVIPKALRSEVLILLHKSHAGIVRTKMLTRSVCWWPGIMSDIEQLIQSCELCQLAILPKAKKELISWPSPVNCWERIHIDFLKFESISYLLVFDVTSKWLDVYDMVHTTADDVIDKLRQSFVTMGLPKFIVSDNGPPFDSEKFTTFCKANGISAIKAPPYHPESNGSAERAVRTIKQSLKKFYLQNKKTGNEMSDKLLFQNFLFSYRNTPCTVTKLSPAEFIFKKKPRTLLDTMKERTDKFRTVDNYKEISKMEKGENVLVRKVHVNNLARWYKGIIKEKLSNVMYKVVIKDTGIERIVHIGDIKKSYLPDKIIPDVTSSVLPVYKPCDLLDPQLDQQPNLNDPKHHIESNVEAKERDIVNISEKDQENCSTVTRQVSDRSHKPSLVTRAGRVIKKPVKLDL